MSQHDMVIANQGFVAFRSDLNDGLQALASTSKGTSRPATPYAGQLWLDETTAVWKLKVYDGTDDITLATIDTTGNVAAALVLQDADGDTKIQVEEGGADEDKIRFDVAGVERMHLAGGILYLGDSANANMTVGVTVNQGTADDEALALKSSDVTHGHTSYAETDTFAAFSKSSATLGGLRIRGLAAATRTEQALTLFAVGDGGGLNITKGTTAYGGVAVEYRGHDGANSLENLAAGGNVFSVTGGGVSGGVRTLFLVDAEGDLHVDGSTSLTAFDAHDDAALARAFDLERSPGQVIRGEFDHWIADRRQALTDAGILGRLTPADVAAGADPLVNITQLQRLHNGAIWQARLVDQALVETLSACLPGFREALPAALARGGANPTLVANLLS